MQRCAMVMMNSELHIVWAEQPLNGKRLCMHAVTILEGLS